MPKLSVLLCTRNRGEKIRNAVDSILANSFSDYELIIVDQSSDGRTAAVMSQYADQRIRYIATDTVGLSRSRNIAIRESSSEIIVFTDDDCICDKGWLASIHTEFEKDPLLMGVYGRVLPYGAGREDLTCPCVIESRERRVVNKPVVPYEFLGHGNNMSFRKTVFRELGLYIESLGAGTWMKAGEDTEVIYRALRKGMKFIYSPEPVVYHDNWVTSQRMQQLQYGYTKAGAAIFIKYALRGDRTAAKHIISRGVFLLRHLLGRLKRLNRDKNLGFAFKWSGSYVLGLCTGVIYLFVPSPKLNSLSTRTK
jgi:glycosyltransferase involved in cell wall biosynthesis